MISFEDFEKIDFRLAKIISAERVEGSDKLLKIEADLGEEVRQIIAGIGKFYNPEELVGKNVVIIANLEPRSLMGLESQGMILAAKDESGLSVLITEKEIKTGTKIT
ncbi:MAG: methionine--tRNA ligase subunit beta [Candidatus Paceibacterota bacterium]